MEQSRLDRRAKSLDPQGLFLAGQLIGLLAPSTKQKKDFSQVNEHSSGQFGYPTCCVLV